MKRLLLALLLAASPAGAATYNVTPTGSGADYTLAEANAAASAGDLVVMNAGNYGSTGIAPANSGAAVSRIRYVGSLSNPGSVVVASISLRGSYVTVMGVQATGSASMFWHDSTAACRGDSIAYCKATSLTLCGARSGVVYKCQFTGTLTFEMSNGSSCMSSTDGGVVWCDSMVVRQNNFDAGTWSGKLCYMIGRTQYCTVDSNRFTGTFSSPGGVDNDDAAYGRYLYYSWYNEFKDNYWKLESAPAVGDQRKAFALRDSSHHNLFLRDTMLLGLATMNPADHYRIGGTFVNNGNTSNTSHHNRWSHCYYLMTGYAQIAEGWMSCDIDSSVFASAYESPIYCESSNPFFNSNIRQNTFYSWNGPAILNKWYIADSTCGVTIRNNIFYVRKIPSAFAEFGGCQNLPTRPVTLSDHNLYWALGCTQGGTPAAARPYSLGVGQNFAQADSGAYCASSSYDCGSKWDNPSFADTTFATFDPQIDSTSAAVGLWVGTDAHGYVGARSPAWGADVPPDSFGLVVTSLHGTVDQDPDSADTGKYLSGTVVALTAYPATGWAFSTWSSDTTSSANPLSLCMTKTRAMTANYAAIPCTLTVACAHGTLTAARSSAPSVPVGLDTTFFQYGEAVKLSVADSSCYEFYRWTGDTSYVYTDTLTVLMLGNRAYTANHNTIVYTLALTHANGDVGIDAEEWDGYYDCRATVTLTAFPDPGYHFLSWSGPDTTATDNPLTISFTHDWTLEAVFESDAATDSFTLTVTSAHGTVSQTPAATGGKYGDGVAVKLDATAATGWVFSSWSGDTTVATQDTLTTIMYEARALTANYTAAQETLTIVAVNGTVSQSPSATGYDYGTVVTLTATPAAGYTFSSWSGGITSTSNPATITMTANATVTANFIVTPAPTPRTSRNRLRPIVTGC